MSGKNILLLFVVLMLSGCRSTQVAPPDPLYPVPTERQLAWHELEQYAFVHFTTNTFTDKEWGYGDEDPDIFNPTGFDSEQWCNLFKESGLKALILTCKHHDGFCLWPSDLTKHSVKYSQWRDGQGDVVKEVRDACKKSGLKFGIYLSPWDRNHAMYGDHEYVKYYRKQLEEIFTNYGPVFEMWFDGANGGTGYYGGADERRNIDKKTYYDWPTTLDLVRNMEPDVIFFSDAGPDIRWCGNERGFAGETNWNTISTDTLFAGARVASIHCLIPAQRGAGSGYRLRWMCRYDPDGFTIQKKMQMSKLRNNYSIYTSTQWEGVLTYCLIFLLTGMALSTKMIQRSWRTGKSC